MTSEIARSDRWLPAIDSWREMLAQTAALEDVKALRDRAEAVRHYASVAGQSLEAQNIAAEAKLWAERRAGEILRDMPKNTGGRPARTLKTPDMMSGVLPAPERPPSLDDIGVSYKQSERWQAVASVPEERFVEYIASTKDAGEEVTTARLLANRNYTGVLLSQNNEWYTPMQYIEAARATMGGIDLDPASSAMANERVGAAKYFDQDTDGLTAEWYGRVWLNPPYGGVQADFTAKLVEAYDDYDVEQAVLLVSAHATDTLWFQPLWRFTLCFTDHRIKFESPLRDVQANTGGSVFAYFGQNQAAFLREFSQFGAVVRRVGG